MSGTLRASGACLVLTLTAACTNDAARPGKVDGGPAALPSTHHVCGEAYAKDPREDTRTGGLVRVQTSDNGTPDDPSDDQYDLLLPQEMLDWLKEQNWIQAHGDWHDTRRWDSGCLPIPGIPCQNVAAMT